MEPVNLLDVVRIATFQPRPGCQHRPHWEQERAARAAEQAAAEQSAKAEQTARQGPAGLRWFKLAFLAR